MYSDDEKPESAKVALKVLRETVEVERHILGDDIGDITRDDILQLVISEVSTKDDVMQETEEEELVQKDVEQQQEEAVTENILLEGPTKKRLSLILE